MRKMAAGLMLMLMVLGLWACGPTVGDPCTTASDCGGQLCLNLATTPGGYCSKTCTPGNDATCPHGSTCEANGGGAGSPACYLTCTAPSGCRTGYQCQPVGGGNPLSVCAG